MKPVESSVVINWPIEACFSYLTDLADDLKWRREWIEAVKTTDGPHGVGARYRLTGALLGRRIATEPAGGVESRVGTVAADLLPGRRQLEGDFPKLKQVLERAG